MLRALIWDVDGTLAETERDGHRVAFNAAFAALDLPWSWNVALYGDLLTTAGGYERLLRFLATQGNAPTDAEARSRLARTIHRRKNEIYEALVRDGEIPLRPGVKRLIDACEHAGIALAIATTTSRNNVVALLATHLGDDWTARFAAIVCAEEAPAKKPDPLAYRLTCERLAIDPRDAVAIEDSPNGVAASTALGIPTIVTRSAYFSFDVFPQAAAICDDLDSEVTSSSALAPCVDVDFLRRLAR